VVSLHVRMTTSLPLGSEMTKIAYFLDSWLRDGGEVVSLTHHPLPPGRSLVLISVRDRAKPSAVV
jgi:hypothetical protein